MFIYCFLPSFPSIFGVRLHMVFTIIGVIIGVTSLLLDSWIKFIDSPINTYILRIFYYWLLCSLGSLGFDPQSGKLYVH